MYYCLREAFNMLIYFNLLCFFKNFNFDFFADKDVSMILKEPLFEDIITILRWHPS